MSRAHDDDRRDRITGRLLRAWEEPQGTSLTADHAIAATTLNVDDVSAFNDDGEGGWLYIGSQVVAYTDVDDDASTITLAAGLAAAAADGDEVSVWNDLYGEVDTVQWADVAVEGEDHNFDTIRAVVADTVNDLANGDRGKPRETVVLERDGDEWELIRVKGRPSKSRGHKWEANDVYTLTAADITAGYAVAPLSFRPTEESVKLVLAGVPQRPTEWAIDYAAQEITVPLDSWSRAGDIVWSHYDYLAGARRHAIPFGASGWKYLLNLPLADSTDRSAVTFDDSAWATGSAAFGSDNHGGAGYDAYGGYQTSWDLDTRMWARRRFGRVTEAQVWVRLDNYADIYWNGTLVESFSHVAGGLEDYADPYSVVIPAGLLDSVENVLAIKASDDATGGSDDAVLDIKVRWIGDPL